MRRDGLALTLLFAAAFAVRLAARVYFGFAAVPTTDEIEMIEPGAAVADGHGLSRVPQQAEDGVTRPSAFRMPLPLLALGAAFAATGEHLRTAYWVMIAVTALSAPLAFLYARAAGAGRPAAVVTGVLFCLYPTWVYYSIQVLSDGFFVPALLAALWLTARAAAANTPGAVALAGLAWGAATLVRPHALPIGGLVALYHAWNGERRLAAAILVGIAACLVPWVARNALVFGQFIPLATESGETFLGSNNPYVVDDPAQHGMWVAPTGIPEYRDRLAPIQGELERSRWQTAVGMEYLKANPEVLPRLAWYKLARWLTPVTATGGVIRAVVLVSYGGLLAGLAVAAVRRRWGSRTLLAYAACGTVALTIVTVVYWGCLTRGRLPLEAVWLPVLPAALLPWRTVTTHTEVPA